MLGLLVIFLLVVGCGGCLFFSFPFLFLLSVWGDPPPSCVHIIFMFLVCCRSLLVGGVYLSFLCLLSVWGDPSLFEILLRVGFACASLVVGWVWWRLVLLFPLLVPSFALVSKERVGSSHTERRNKMGEETTATNPTNNKRRTSKLNTEEKRPKRRQGLPHTENGNESYK